MNAFEGLGLTPALLIDDSELDKQFRDLSKTMHPDRFVAEPASKRREAAEPTVKLNEDYRTLRDPIKRAEELFRLANIPFGDGREPSPDPEFLMTILEAREKISELRADNQVEPLTEVTKNAEAAFKATLQKLGQAFARGLAAEDVRLLGTMRYEKRLLDDALAAQAELEDRA